MKVLLIDNQTKELNNLIKLLKNYGVEFFVETHLNNVLIEHGRIKEISFKTNSDPNRKVFLRSSTSWSTQPHYIQLL